MNCTFATFYGFDEECQVYVDAVLRVFTQTESIVLQKKTFKPWTTPNEFYQVISTILDGQYPFKTDGIIIQPLDHIYDSSVQLIPLSQRRLNLRPDLLKWKPPQLLTIDLELQKTQKSEPGPNGPVTNTIKYELLMNRRGQTQRIPFRGSTIYPFDPQRDIVINKYMEYPNGTILEFRWNSDLKKLEPIKDRDEKPTPNNDDIALDVWEDIHQPIDQDVITGRKWSLMFRYHNREKSEIYKIVSGGAVVSMGTGAGGDIFKWQRANVTHVLCIEPNQENRVELQQRLQAVNTIQYRIVPTVGQDYPLILQNLTEFYGKQVDILEYMLSLSFFFDNDQSLVSILQAGQLVRPGGHLLAFTIDGRKVVSYFQNPANRDIIDRGDERIYRSKFQGIQFELHTPLDFDLDTYSLEVGTVPDSRLSILINIPGSIVRDQTEYLVNIPRLTGSLAQYNWTLINEKPATNESFMTSEEFTFSSMFTSLIYQKQK